MVWYSKARSGNGLARRSRRGAVGAVWFGLDGLFGCGRAVKLRLVGSRWRTAGCDKAVGVRYGLLWSA
jgi:hypothetical protein